MTDYQTVHWDGDKPYWIVDDQPHYIPPATALQMDDPRVQAWGQSQGATPSGGFLHKRGEWNVGTGHMDQGINLGNLLSAGTLAAITAGAGSLAFGGGGAATAVPGVGTMTTTTGAALPTATIGGVGADVAAKGGGFINVLKDAFKGTGLLDKIGDAGQVISGAGKGMQDSRLADALAQSANNSAQLQRATFAQNNPLARTQQVATGDTLKNVQDYSRTFAPPVGNAPSQVTATGGLRPSLYGPDTRAAGDELKRQALQALMTKSDVPDIPPVSKASPVETGLGVTGFLGSLAGAFGKRKAVPA